MVLFDFTRTWDFFAISERRGGERERAEEEEEEVVSGGRGVPGR